MSGTERATNDRARAITAHVRTRVLELSYRAHVGHIGSCLSVAEILGAVYASEHLHLAPADRRDVFVLGKGHAGLALYCALEAMGYVVPADLDTFGSDGTPFGVHPELGIPGVDVATGSLGQGLGSAVGWALGARIQQRDQRVVALLSDAECNAGATSEAVQFAGHHRLGNLVAIVDVNGQQALGATADILDPEPFGARWELSGWLVRDVDGHDVGALGDAIRPAPHAPVVVIARTVFGRGVSFMERQLDWHYLPMDAGQYEQARAEQASHA
jgi:transketolase